MRVPFVFGLALLAVAAWTQQPPADRLSDLKAKAETAAPSDQNKLFVEIARLEYEAAKNAYNAGNGAQAQSALKDLNTYAERATRVAIDHGKRLKHTEIDLRKIADHLKNLKPTLNVDERAPVQQSIDQLEKMRTELMSTMFSKK
jgi:hypothetical protein